MYLLYVCVCMYTGRMWEWETERQTSYVCTAYKHFSISQTLFPGQIPLGADLNLPPHSYLVAACPYDILIKIPSSSFSDCLTSLLGMNSCCSSCLECFPSKKSLHGSFLLITKVPDQMVCPQRGLLSLSQCGPAPSLSPKRLCSS